MVLTEPRSVTIPVAISYEQRLHMQSHARTMYRLCDALKNLSDDSYYLSQSLSCLEVHVTQLTPDVTINHRDEKIHL